MLFGWIFGFAMLTMRCHTKEFNADQVANGVQVLYLLLISSDHCLLQQWKLWMMSMSFLPFVIEVAIIYVCYAPRKLCGTKSMDVRSSPLYAVCLVVLVSSIGWFVAASWMALETGDRPPCCLSCLRDIERDGTGRRTCCISASLYFQTNSTCTSCPDGTQLTMYNTIF